MKNANKETLRYYDFDIPGDFPLKINVPIYFNVLEQNFQELIEYINKELVVQKLHLLDVGSSSKDFWKTYNIFSVDLDSIAKIKNCIIESYYSYLKSVDKLPKEILYINGWVSILEEGYYVQRHCHGSETNAYISGFINLKESKNSSTIFYPPQFEYIEDVGSLIADNIKNQIVLFPQWLYHSVPQIEEGTRIDIGFDLFTQEAMDYYNANNFDKDLPIKRAIKLI